MMNIQKQQAARNQQGLKARNQELETGKQEMEVRNRAQEF